MKKKLFIETFGCQMNFSDSEIVGSIMKKEGYSLTEKAQDADLIFVNTCSIREKAEQTVRNRLKHYKGLQKKNSEVKIGVLGCMAERLKTKLFTEEKVDIVVGPDAYRTLPSLVKEAEADRPAFNVFLSREETYSDIVPVRLLPNKVTAFISIMRGCDNMCSFCVVPFTRGRERSRDPQSIIAEAKDLFEKGYREVTLLGQNVDSYLWSSDDSLKGKQQIQKAGAKAMGFSELLKEVAEIHPDLRIRFSTSHPRDITDKVLKVMSEYENICKHIHFPLQSGSSRVLALMNRGYNKQMYKSKIEQIRKILGEDCSISADIIAGFCTETEADHRETLEMMELVQYDFSYMFIYSERPNTIAAKRLKDDIPLQVKKNRLTEIINLQKELSFARNRRDVSKTFRVLIEGVSKRSADYLQGRNSQNKVVVFPKPEGIEVGTYVNVKVEDCTSATLLGKLDIKQPSAKQLATA